MSYSPSLYKRQRLKNGHSFLLWCKYFPAAVNSSDSEDSRPDSSDPNHQGPALALHLQRKHVASEVNATLLKPPKESTPRAGRTITVGCIMTRIMKVPFARFASSLGRLVMFSIVKECGSLSPSRTGRKLLKN